MEDTTPDEVRIYVERDEKESGTQEEEESVANVIQKEHPRKHQWRNPFLKALRKVGFVNRAAAIAGITTKTAHLHYNRFPRFAKRWDAALAENRAKKVRILEKHVFKRATVGWKEPIYQGGEHVGDKPKYSDGLAAKLLDSWEPGTYAKPKQVEITGKGGGALQVEAKQLNISPADIEMVRALLSGVQGEPLQLPGSGPAT